jgi:hypothetical protein
MQINMQLRPTDHDTIAQEKLRLRSAPNCGWSHVVDRLPHCIRTRGGGHLLMVTRRAWMAARLQSSKRCTMKSSVAWLGWRQVG